MNITLELEKVMSGPSLAKGSKDSKESETKQETKVEAGYNEKEGANVKASYTCSC